MNGPTFDPGDGRGSLRYLFHPHNCGVGLSTRRTERTVELPIAARWLSSVDPASVIELGAVTPYYWPGRIARVIDPADVKATERASLFDVDLAGRDVLSISTIEHVGEGRYGLEENRTPLEALVFVVERAACFLITFPTGLQRPAAQRLEAFVLDRIPYLADRGVSVRLLARNADETWSPTFEPQPYGDKRKPWANGIVILERRSNAQD